MSIFFTAAFEWGLIIGICMVSLLASLLAIFSLPEKIAVQLTQNDEPKM